MNIVKIRQLICKMINLYVLKFTDGYYHMERISNDFLFEGSVINTANLQILNNGKVSFNLGSQS